MTTAFDQAFGLDYLRSLGSDNPDQSVMQGVDTPQNAMQQPYIQPQDVTQAGGDQLSYQPQQPGPQEAPPQSQNQPNIGGRQRLSFMEILGRLGNVLATAHTGAAQYLTPLQQQQQRQLEQQKVDAGGLDLEAKRQDIAQTSTAAQQNHNQIMGGFARGLQSLQSAGSDLGIAAPALAQHLGIPVQQAQQIAERAKADPNFLQAFADAADPQKGGSAGKALALAFTNAVGPDGKPVLLQAGADGQAHKLEGYTPLGDVKVVNNGATNDVINKQGKVVRSFTKSGDPESGSAPITDKDGKVVGYQALPGSTREATNTKINLGNQATVQKMTEAEKARTTALASARTDLSTLKAGIDKLARLKAQPSQNQNMVGNLVNVMQGTAAGQEVSKVTNPAVAQARGQIKAAAQSLMLNMSNGRSQMFRTQLEQTRFLNMINDPTTPISVMRQSLKSVEARVVAATAPAKAAPVPAAAPAKTAPRAKLTVKPLTDQQLLAKYMGK